MNRRFKVFFSYLSIFVIVVLFFLIYGFLFPKKIVVERDYSDLIKSLQNGEVVYLEVVRDTDISDSGTARRIVFKNGEVQNQIQIPSMSSFMTVANFCASHYRMSLRTISTPKAGIWIQILSPFILGALLIIPLFFILKKVQGGNGGKILSFGSSKAKSVQSDENKITFDNVAGLDEEKIELQELVEFLKTPKKFCDIGARIPRGVLLVGPPGTGKTLLAKAVAGEAGVPFFSISGSDFVEMFVGVGASRVRDLFEQAKKDSPCIVFIDEIDAVGRRRGAGLGGGHDEREQTLNQLLVEMDGFNVNQGVIVVAATNRPDVLDPALLRPGRFDRQVVVARPDIKGREEILKVHSVGKIIGEDVNLKVVAQTTSGFTGADLENLLNEAALLAARANKKEITMEEIRRAFIKVGVGTEKKSRVISEREKRITAYHEAGHAILFEVLPELDGVHMISIIPTGMAGGYTMNLPTEEKSYMGKKYMFQEIISLLGGRAAEELVIEDITSGASNDIERATNMARNMVTRYGMSDKLGPIQFGDSDEQIFLGRDIGHTRNYSEESAREIDTEVKSIISNAYDEAKHIIQKNIEILHKTAALLIEKEKITGDEFRELFVTA